MSAWTGLGPAAGALGLGGRLGRRAAATVLDAAGSTALAGLDAALGWRYTDEAVRRVLASPLAERTIATALGGPLVESVAREVARHAVIERVASELVAAEAVDQIDRLVESVVDSPEMQRVVARTLESELLDTVVARLLESEELWLLVDEIAHSPAVTDAIGRQSVGFAEQVAGQVRLGSQRADAGLERAAARLLRRRARAADPQQGS